MADPKKDMRSTRPTEKQTLQWEVDWARDKNQDELLALFESAFGQTMPVSQWRWKYAHSDPLGSIVYVNGELVAFYGGMPRKIRFFGQDAQAVQIGDVMVAPRYRRILSKHGAFFRAAASFCEGMVGSGKPYICAFGFPSERHFRLGERLDLYGRVGQVLEASWSPQLPQRKVRITAFEPENLGLVNPLWQVMKEELSDRIVLVRDDAYFNHRFLQHPTIDYRIFVVRRRLFGKPLGILVLRDHGPDGVELLDMIGSTRYMPLFIAASRQIVAEMGRNRLFSWLTETVAEVVAETSPHLEDLKIPLPTFTWSQPPDVLKARDHWWLTGGDSDFR